MVYSEVKYLQMRPFIENIFRKIFAKTVDKEMGVPLES